MDIFIYVINSNVNKQPCNECLYKLRHPKQCVIFSIFVGERIFCLAILKNCLESLLFYSGYKNLWSMLILHPLHKEKYYHIFKTSNSVEHNCIEMQWPPKSQLYSFFICWHLVEPYWHAWYWKVFCTTHNSTNLTFSRNQQFFLMVLNFLRLCISKKFWCMLKFHFFCYLLSAIYNNFSFSCNSPTCTFLYCFVSLPFQCEQTPYKTPGLHIFSILM